MTFKLEIELGNDAMKSGLNVAAALRDLTNNFPRRFMDGDEQTIRDVNGNTVGKWEVTK